MLHNKMDSWNWPGPGPRLHGIFASLQKLDIFDHAPAVDLYGEGFADFWECYVGKNVGDIPIFQRFLPRPDARVLDLACGAGRIGIALARDGARVDGLELSPAMLALTERNLADEAPEVKHRLRFFQGDMCNFSLQEKYDLIVLGVVSISLLPGSPQRLALFNRVREHLRPGGKFVFDIMNLSGERWKKHDNYMDVWSREDENGQEFAIVGQRCYPEEKCFSFNVYRECIAWNGDTSRTLGVSTKAWIDADEIPPALEQSGLKLTSEFDHDDVRYYVAALVEDM